MGSRVTKAYVSPENQVFRLRRVWLPDQTAALSCDCLWPGNARGRLCKALVENGQSRKPRSLSSFNGLHGKIHIKSKGEYPRRSPSRTGADVFADVSAATDWGLIREEFWGSFGYPERFSRLGKQPTGKAGANWRRAFPPRPYDGQSNR